MEKLKSISKIYNLVGLPKDNVKHYPQLPNILPLYMFSHLFDLWGIGEITTDKKQPFKHTVVAEIEIRNNPNKSLKEWIYCVLDEHYAWGKLFYLITPEDDFPFQKEKEIVYTKSIILSSENDNHTLSDEGEKTNLHNASDRFYFENHLTILGEMLKYSIFIN